MKWSKKLQSQLEAILGLLVTHPELNFLASDLRWAIRRSGIQTHRLLVLLLKVIAWNALKHGDNLLLELVLKAGAPTDDEGMSSGGPFRFAVENGLTREVGLMLKYPNGSDFNSTPVGQKSPIPFRLAVRHAHDGIVKLMLRKQCIDVNESTDELPPPLMDCLCLGGCEPATSDMGRVLKRLLASERINLDFLHPTIGTPFFSAVHSCANWVVKAFLRCKRFDPNYRDNEGNTVLHLAVATPLRRDRIALLLRSPRIDRTIRNFYGYTPEMIAIATQRPKIAEMFYRIRPSD